MQIRALKYSLVFAAIGLGFFSLLANSFLTWSLPFYTFIIIPALELLFPPVEVNLTEAEAEVARADRMYDWLLYLVVPVQYALLGVFCWRIWSTELSWVEFCGLIFSMGISCGVMGINVAHELGHRVKKGEQFLSKSLLLTSLYMLSCTMSLLVEVHL